MPMTKSGIGREIAKCAVLFLKEWKHAHCVSVLNCETGNFDALYAVEKLDMGKRSRYGYRVYVDDAGGYCILPFWMDGT